MSSIRMFTSVSLKSRRLQRLQQLACTTPGQVRHAMRISRNLIRLDEFLELLDV